FQATPPPAFVKAVEEICYTCGGAHPYYQCLTAGGNTFPELRDNIQGYITAATVNYNQGNFVYRPPGSGSLPRNTVANLKGELKAITTRSGIVLDGPSILTPPPFINSREDERVEEALTDRISLTLILMPKYQKMLKSLLSNNEKLQELANTPLNENFSAVILKKLPKKLRDPGKFLIPCGFSELKCKALADLDNRAISTPAGIVRDVFIPVDKFTFPADFVIVDYKSDFRVPFILGRPFLWTARALITVHREEMILCNGDERLNLNMRHDTSSYSNQPQKESINLINVFNDTKGGNVLLEKLLDLDSTKDLYPPLHVNPLRGSTTSFSSPNQLLEEFANELALITFPLEYDDDIQFDIESDLKEIEYLLHHDPIKDIYFSLKYSIDQIESDTENVYNDPFYSKGEKIKESKLLIDELDLPCDFLLPSEYDLILSEDFSRVDALPSTKNEDKKNKKLAISHASLMIEDFDPPLYELPFFKEVSRSKMLLPF
nr:hypothetical protein [Tanacetum cinerariifolium]